MGKLSILLRNTNQFSYYFFITSRSAYFEGQIEQPVRGLIALITHQDIPVLIAVNSKGLYIIDDVHCVSDFKIFAYFFTILVKLTNINNTL